MFYSCPCRPFPSHDPSSLFTGRSLAPVGVLKAGSRSYSFHLLSPYLMIASSNSEAMSHTSGPYRMQMPTRMLALLRLPLPRVVADAPLEPGLPFAPPPCEFACNTSPARYEHALPALRVPLAHAHSCCFHATRVIHTLRCACSCLCAVMLVQPPPPIRPPVPPPVPPTPPPMPPPVLPPPPPPAAMVMTLALEAPAAAVPSSVARECTLFKVRRQDAMLAARGCRLP